MSDPKEDVKRIPLAKGCRQHLRQEIDYHPADLTHVTDRVGRPLVLVCTNTTASYEAACQIYQRDKANLKRIVEIESKLT